VAYHWGKGAGAVVMRVNHAWQGARHDCQHARTTALNSRCAIYYPELPSLFLPSKQS
jgi:hypothetical protein